MEKEKLIVTAEEASDMVFGDSDDFRVIQDEITDHSRWVVSHEVIVQRISDGAFFCSYYSVGATECQDQSAYEYDEPIFDQVERHEKMVVVYK